MSDLRLGDNAAQKRRQPLEDAAGEKLRQHSEQLCPDLSQIHFHAPLTT